MKDEPEDEFYEDFGSPPPADAEIEGMIARARAVGDVPLRRALKYHLTLRHIAEALLQRAEEAPHEENDQVLKLSRFIVRGEGGLGNDEPLQRPWWKLW